MLEEQIPGRVVRPTGTYFPCQFTESQSTPSTQAAASYFPGNCTESQSASSTQAATSPSPDHQTRHDRLVDSLDVQYQQYVIEQIFMKLPEEAQRMTLNTLFAKLSQSSHMDFPSLSIHVMDWLQKNNKTNILYNLAYGLATQRPNGSDSRLPVKRMPFGLLEYNINFFAANTVEAVSLFPS